MDISTSTTKGSLSRDRRKKDNTSSYQCCPRTYRHYDHIESYNSSSDSYLDWTRSRGQSSSSSHLHRHYAIVGILVISLTLVLDCVGAQPQQFQDQGQQAWNTADYYKREHSLTRPYQGTGWQIPYWDFHGSTIVTNQYVRLTPDARSQQGALWNSVAVPMKNWEVQMQFQVTGKGKDLFGDGLVFWYSRDRMIPGPVFGSKDYYMGMGIFIDTYSNHNGPHNHQHPYVSAMVNNGTLHYDHDKDGTHTQLSGCEAKLRNLQHDTWLAIRYENDVLSVSTDILGKNAWAPCLRVEGVQLPTGYFFGVSAATGDLSDNHDVIAIKTYELDAGPGGSGGRDQIVPSAQTFEAARERVEDKPAGWSGIKIFFVTLFGILGIIAVVVIGIMVYENHKQNARKRFY